MNVIPIICPLCHGSLSEDRDHTLRCCQCAAIYPRRATADVLLTDAEWAEYLQEWEQEKDFLLERYSTARRRALLEIMYYDMWAARMFALIPPECTGPLLEIMAGEGELVRRRPPQITSAVMFDINVNALERAAQYFMSTGETRIQVVGGTVGHLPFPAESFNIVMVQGGLHHVRFQLSRVLAEVHRVLRPGGILVGSEPANDCWLTRRIRHWQYKTSKHQGNDRGEDGFTRAELNALLSAIGFDLKHYTTFGFIAYPLMGNIDLLPFLTKSRSRILGKTLLGIDALLECIPLIRNCAWANLFQAYKKPNGRDL
jgi:ubiquinone/menaquinone biosynthesis C-methylase UbiE